MSSLKRVTFTGADDSTSIDEMLHLSDYNPWVEWGILLPPKDNGGRFPSLEWIKRLVGTARLASFKVELAGHLCEPWAEMILAGNYSPRDYTGEAFDRFQLNTHGVGHNFVVDWFEPLLADGREIILQIDNVTSARLLTSLLHKFKFPVEPLKTFSGLHDLSHGAGVLPATWPAPVPGLEWTGYAGGLGPQNLAAELPRIIEAVGVGQAFWVDMETHVRSNGKFDLEKVKACIKIARPWIEG